MSRASWAAGALALVCLFVAGCSSSSDADSPGKAVETNEAAAILKDANESGSPQQTEALADGHVSVEEMKASIDAFQTCLASTSTGWRLEEVYPDPIHGEPHFTWAVVSDSPDRDSAEVDDCDIRTYRFVNVFAQSIQGPGPMDPAIRARTGSCLDDAGVRTSPDDRTDVEIFITAGKKEVDNVVNCLQSDFRAEFPDRAAITIGLPEEVGKR